MGNNDSRNESSESFEALKTQVNMIDIAVGMIVEILKQIYKPKEVLPPKFKSDDSQSLRSFLNKFEGIMCQPTLINERIG